MFALIRLSLAAVVICIAMHGATAIRVRAKGDKGDKTVDDAERGNAEYERLEYYELKELEADGPTGTGSEE